MKTLSIGRLVYDINILMDGYPTEGTENETKEMITCSGGAANIVAYSLGKWNMESFISGAIGYDDIGSTMKKNMEENKVKINYLETNYDVKTPTSYILLNKQNNSRTIIEAKIKDFNIKKYEYDIDMDCVIVDGNEYNASAYALNKYREAITILNAKVPKQALLNYFKLVKYVVCSSDVAEAMTGLKLDFNNPITLSTVYKKIVNKYPNINLIITIEGKGTIYSVNNEIKVLATINTDIVDKTGARDIFVAMVGYGLTNKYDIETTIRLATIAESMSKKTIGSTLSIPILSDVIKYYEDKFGKINKGDNRENNFEEKSNESNYKMNVPINNNISNNLESNENQGSVINSSNELKNDNEILTQVFGTTSDISSNDNNAPTA